MELWKDIPGWEGYYQVSDTGGVRSIDRIAQGRHGAHQYKGRTLKQTPATKGYLTVKLSRSGIPQRGYQVHRLVLSAFVGECPEGLEACHADDVKTNNKLTNLRYDTSKNNTADAIRNGVFRGLGYR